MSGPAGEGPAAQPLQRDVRDITLLFVTRTVRLFAYGSIGVILAIFLSEVGLSDQQIGVLLTLTLIGDSAISLGVTQWADRVGRRALLCGSCALVLGAGLVYGLVPHPSFLLLLAAATVGVISPSGNEVGPFMALEQSILSELVDRSSRTHVFAWYNLVGYACTALGSLAAGHALKLAAELYGIGDLEGFRGVFVAYGGSGLVLFLLFLLLTDRVELPHNRRRRQQQQQQQQAGSKGTHAGAGDEESGLRAPLLPPAAADAAQVTSFPLRLTDDGSEHAGGGKTEDGEAEGGDAQGAPKAPAPAAASQPQPQPQQAPAVASSGGATGGGAGSGAGPSAGAGAAAPSPGRMGLSPRSQRIVAHLAVLFATDSFAGGLTTGTLLAYYFQTTYGVSTAYLGGLLFGANVIAAVSSLLSGYVAARLGLINTMVFTHLPSNVLMIAVPLMPNLQLATAMVFARFSISQMDVAPRAAYVAGVVRPEERTSAMGILNIAKSVGAAFGPLLTGYLAEQGLFMYAFYLCGGLKIVYDLSLLWSFSHIKPEH